MAFHANSRPAGMSDEESGDDYSGGDSDEDFDFGGGFKRRTGTVTVAPVVVKQEVLDEPEDQSYQQRAPCSTLTSTSQQLPATVSVGGGVAGVGRGRGRGRGIKNSPQGSPAPPPPQEGNLPPFSPLHQQPERDEDEEPQRNWCNGRGRGHSFNNRHRRRSGSSSPTSGGPNDRRKLKEALLRRVPGFGAVPKQESWAKEMSRHLKQVWEADQKTPRPQERKFTQELHSAFWKCREVNCWNVPCFALYLVISSTDFLAWQGSKNQAQAVCRALIQFIVGARSCTPVSSTINHALLSFPVDLQQVAFEAAVFQKKESLLKLILESFQLTTQQPPQLKSFLLQEIQKIIQRKEYTEACFCVTQLKLHSSFDVHAFLVPLILQDKPAVVEDFLNNAPPDVPHSKELIKFLDEQFQYGNNAVFRQLVMYKTQKGIPDTKDDKFNYKPISKLIKRLRTKYNLGFDCCPNIGHRQRFGELRHLFGRRYEKNEMSTESFNELIDQLSEDDPELKEDILNYYMEYQDNMSAAQFITKHKLFSSSLCQNDGILPHLPEPWKSEWEEKMRKNLTIKEECWDDEDDASAPQKSTSSTIECGSIQIKTEPLEPESWEEEENWETMEQDAWEEPKKPKTKNYYCHPLPRSSIIIITDPHQVLDMCEVLAQASTSKIPVVSGLDSEWKPIMSKTCGAALLQLAFEDGIHLLDLISLKENLRRGNGPDYCIWKALRKTYFENEAILKLGFDLRNDVKMLTETVPEWQGLNTSWKRMLDLSVLKSLILKECPHLFHKKDGSVPSTEGESGLSELVYLCTDKSLSKEEQMSDWEKRPLRESQILYASSDAFCLISIYRTLEQLCQEKGVNLERIVENYCKGLAKGDLNGGGANSSKRKKGSLELVLDLVRLPGMLGEGENLKKSDTKSVKLVVDTMLLGLGRYLRSLGFDTVMLGNNEGHEMCVRYVRKEGRRVVTRGLQAYGRIAESLNECGEEEQMLYLVKSETTAAQLEEICRHFNVILNPTRLFTICFRCNTSVFIKTPLALIYTFMELAGCHLYERPRTPSGSLDEEALAQTVENYKNKSFDDMILYCDEEQERSKSWMLIDDDCLKIMDGGKIIKTGRGERVELARLQVVSHLLDQVYICNGCGKCYWSSRLLEEYYKKMRN